MTSIEEFEFWCGEYRDNPHMADRESERLLADMCIRGNSHALAWVKSLTTKQEADTRLPDSAELTYRAHLAEDEAAGVGRASRRLSNDEASEELALGYAPNWNAIATSLKNRRGWRCEVCRFEKFGSALIHVHHIDGDKSDNSDANLQVLCAECHGAKHGGTWLQSSGVSELERTDLLRHRMKWLRGTHR
jgi:hypothetical protein